MQKRQYVYGSCGTLFHAFLHPCGWNPYDFAIFDDQVARLKLGRVPNNVLLQARSLITRHDFDQYYDSEYAWGDGNWQWSSQYCLG